MATTRIISMHVNLGKTIADCLTDRIGYSKNPDKTQGGELISAYQCDPKTADAEFLFSKRQYKTFTGREQRHDVIAYQVRQSFKPGEITPEDALRAVLAGEKEHTPRRKKAQGTRKKDALLIDIEAKLQAGKGGGYERWAKVFNVKQMAQTYNYLREHGLLDYEELEARAAAATERYHALSAQIKAAEGRMAEIAVLKTHIANYAKTRDVYAGYRKAGYSRKYLAEHESDILLHKAAKKAFDELGVKRLPSVKSLQEEYDKLLSEKKAAYAEYRRSRDEMRELLLHKQNVDRMLGKNEREEEKKKEHDRQ